jgi:hypothetical protein
MSHIVQIQTEVRDPVAIVSAAIRLQLPQPAHGKFKLSGGCPVASTMTRYWPSLIHSRNASLKLYLPFVYFSSMPACRSQTAKKRFGNCSPFISRQLPRTPMILSLPWIP